MTVDIKDVSWVREGRPILKNINWSVKPGEHWAIVGLNGSGKTTLLNIINGYIWPTTGKVSILGQAFGSVDLRELRKAIGWVSSSLQEKIYRRESAKEIVLSGKYASIGLFEQPQEADVQRALEILDQLGCARLAERPFQTLSQGEKQKVLIGRALMTSPRLLILDEPCTGLDLFSREQLLMSIERLGRLPDAPTMLYVTHHTEEILPIFSHTLLLRRGEIYSAGKTADVLTSDNLTSFFEAPVDIHTKDGRLWINILLQPERA
ncbi:ABC transporter ATP-binding protein [Brevibacillus sp. B_LB10_24]|uniref:ABC transporter ATP-binding protein n=1 Tax=Brevibacillus sp. B_LB10_24 TaxID=3380645 RepID=UPI0038BBCAB3